MELAARGIAQHARSFNLEGGVLLLVGKGHNGADALVAGCHLLQDKIAVTAWPLCPLEACRPLTAENWQRFVLAGGSIIHEPPQNLPSLIIDGLLGTGFSGALSEPYRECIRWVNSASLPVLAIDIPSGVNGADGEAPLAVQATKTLALGYAKIGSFINDGWKYSGNLTVHPIGIPFSGERSFLLLLKEEALSSLPKIERLRNKYSIGPLALIARSSLMSGAAKLASLAAYRAGAGLVRILSSEPLSDLPWEVVTEICQKGTPLNLQLAKNRALLIGPGLTLNEETTPLLKAALAAKVPLVIDASALTWLAKEGINPPKGAILTPHLGEFNRLLLKRESRSISPPSMKRSAMWKNTR